jgi:short-subunit dehydrogenase
MWKILIAVALVIASIVYYRRKRRESQRIRLHSPIAFQNKTVLITGASSGIGEELAYRYVKGGAKVVICARRELELKRVQQKCKQEYNNDHVYTLVVDVSTESGCEHMINEGVKLLGGRLDILILNAGMTSLQRFRDAKDLKDHKRLMDLNYWGCVHSTFYALPIMKKQNSGIIFVVSSIAGKTGTLFRTSYAASKHALHGFFGSLRLELISEKIPIQITVACPGFVKTNIHDNAIGSTSENLKRDWSQFMTAQECADIMLAGIEDGLADFYIDNLGALMKYISPFIPQNMLDQLIIKKTLAAASTD